MSESRRIPVHSVADVINARLQARQMAKDAGIPIMDQARISLAVSSLAHIICLGETYTGLIVLNRINGDGRSGLQVFWELRPDGDFQAQLDSLNDSSINLMVDDLQVEMSPEVGVSITAVKWAPRRGGVG